MLKKSSNVTWNLKSMGMRINFGYRSNSARWRWLYYRIQWQRDDNRPRMCLHSAHLNQLMLITKNRGSGITFLFFGYTPGLKKKFHFDCMCSIFAEFLCANSHESLSVRRSNWVTTGGNRLLKMVSGVSNRHLQIVAGMERFEYVVVYWILITETEAILKKKVPKIATGSF